MEQRTFEALYGLEVERLTDEEATGSVPVRDAVRQPLGLVHGGLYATIAESLASLATGAAVAREGGRAVGLTNATSFLRPIADGTVHAAARRLHAGRTTWVWDVEITDDDGRRCAVVRTTIRVSPAGPPKLGDGVSPQPR